MSSSASTSVPLAPRVLAPSPAPSPAPSFAITPSAQAIDKLAFRHAMGQFATGVAVVTTHDAIAPQGKASAAGFHPIGLTINSFSSVSLEPPLVCWSLNRKSSNLAHFDGAASYAINVLASDQTDLAKRFSQPIQDRFAGVDWRFNAFDLPIIAGALAHFSCKVVQRLELGDHIMYVGEVIALDDAPAGAPLVFHGGKFLTGRQD